MAKLAIPSGATSKRIAIFIQDSSSTTGAGLTGLTNASSGLTCYSWIDTDGNAAGTSQALQSATRGTWTTRGFIEKDSTNMPGWYEFGVPDALLAAGVKWAALHFKGATNMAPLPIEIEVTATSNQDAVRGGMTALPNANAEAAGGLYTRGSGAGQINQPANGQIDTNVVKWNGTAVASPATAGIPDVNVKNFGNTAVTGRDVGASVLLSTGTGTGQLDFTSGVVKANLAQILGTALTETAGLLAGGFKKIFNIATPASTMDALTLVATATNVTTVNGLAAGVITATSIAADAITAAKVADGTIDAATFAASAITASAIAADAITAAKIADGAIDAATFAAGAINAAAIAADAITDAKVASDVTIASVTGAVGSVTGAVGSVTGAVGSVTGAVGSVTGNVGGNLLGTLSTTERAAIADALLDRDMSTGTDSGSTTVRTVRQALRALRNKWSIAAGTLTVTKENDSTTSWTASVTTSAGDPVSTIDPAGP